MVLPSEALLIHEGPSQADEAGDHAEHSSKDAAPVIFGRQIVPIEMNQTQTNTFHSR